MSTSTTRTTRRRLLAAAPGTALAVAGILALVATGTPGRGSALAIVLLGLLGLGLPLWQLRSGRPDVQRRAVGSAWAFAVLIWWVPAARLAPQLPGAAWTVLVLSAAAAAYLLGYLLAGPDASNPPAPAARPPHDAVRTPLAPGERYLWSRTVLSRPTLAVAALLLVAAALQLLSGAGSGVVVALVAVAVLTTALSAFARVRVDGDGVHVRQALLGRTLTDAPLDEVRSARAEQLDPDRFRWNDYGPLRRSPGLLGYRARRSGEALVLDLTRGREFVVTVADAATAAGLVNAELDRRAERGAVPPC
ncbi:hypothetical protein [Pseudonocardia spirodelae]|uniref:PH domain-containing protein n=1 Tax=Pseudonocardia spirodelae TaxID=3133431 RepID=A0ABU8T851_9PSEU